MCVCDSLCTRACARARALSPIQRSISALSRVYSSILEETLRTKVFLRHARRDQRVFTYPARANAHVHVKDV